MHSQSEGHLRAMLVVGENAGKHIDDFSKQFQNEFLQLLSRRYNTKQTRANQVYQEYIQDKSHLHMNATRWVTLTEFVKHLGREGLVRAEENEKGWWISWVDNSPKALARQAESQKRERADMDDEQRQRKQLAEQIERAQRQAEEQARRDGVDGKEKALVRDEGGPRVVLSLAPPPLAAPTPPPTITTKTESNSPEQADTTVHKTESTDPPRTDSASPAPTSTPASVPTPAPVAKPLSITNPLKRPPPSHNVFKQSNKSAKTTSASDAATAQNLAKKQYLTAAEKLMLEDIERKRRVGSSGGGGPGGVGASRGIGYTGMGPSRGPARR
ncbi:hypothetical protein QFC24_006353 [Naganishia onofrii]|uniref:Uncharacterized protein n=1 Tax=Naganishia onofrii TaxID=1851511 RepID=A0ACC2X3T2_9TREE|nr:hypothetical protein QFC24_006353 [Naganishia onofrii]